MAFVSEVWTDLRPRGSNPANLIRWSVTPPSGHLLTNRQRFASAFMLSYARGVPFEDLLLRP
jgi:hypothetical protein